MTKQNDIFDYSAIRVLCARCDRPMTSRRRDDGREDWLIHAFACEEDACCRAESSEDGIRVMVEVPAGGEAMAADGSIHIRNISMRCGRCAGYPALAHFRRADDWNVYTYTCEPGTCTVEESAFDLFVAVDRDAFARRDPKWRGGARHGGAAP